MTMSTAVQVLRRIIKRLARLAPPAHRDLASGMVAELDAISDPREQTRFALGGVVAVLRLVVNGTKGSATIPTWKLMRQHAVPFATALVTLTACILVLYATHTIPALLGRNTSAGTIIEAMALSIPFIIAMMAPMAVFIAVLSVFTGLGAKRPQSMPPKSRRMLIPVLGASAVIAALMLVINSEVVPRTNARLGSVLFGGSAARSDREMTLGELRRAEKSASIEGGAWAKKRAIHYRVEIQKKLALAAACMVLALAAAAISIRLRRGGIKIIIPSSVVMFVGYCGCLMGGESLAVQQRISPFLGMWGVNLVGAAVIAIFAWRPGDRDGPEAFVAH
jgi:lipopolysaccharide export LptBFGC system permease protein LptF